MGRDLERGAFASSFMWAVVAVLALSGCRSAGAVDEAQRGPYRVASVEVEAVDSEQMVADWAPVTEVVERWFEKALRDSDRGVSRQEAGMAMRARVQHRARIDNRRDGARLIVVIEVELERTDVVESASAVRLVAKSEFRHPFALGQPSRPLLVPISHTLTRQAVDHAVAQLRDQAVVRQALGEELVERINDPRSAESARVLAIERLVRLAPDGASAALAVAAQDKDEEVAMAAARALFNVDRASSAQTIMKVAQRMSRDRDYERYLALLPLLGELDEPWVALYLETVAEAHRIRRVREQARALLEKSAVSTATGGGPQGSAPQ